MIVTLWGRRTYDYLGTGYVHVNGSEKCLVLEDATAHALVVLEETAAKLLKDNTDKTIETRFLVLVEWAEPDGTLNSMKCWVEKIKEKPKVWTLDDESKQLTIGNQRQVLSVQDRRIICKGSVKSDDGIFFIVLDKANAHALLRHWNASQEKQFRVHAEWKGSSGEVSSTACWVAMPTDPQSVDGFRGKWRTMAVDQQSREGLPPVGTKLAPQHVTLWDRSAKKLQLETHVIKKAITGDLAVNYDVTLLNTVFLNMKALHPLLPILSKEVKEAKEAIEKTVAPLRQAMMNLEQSPSGNDKEKIQIEIEGKQQSLRRILSANTPTGRFASQPGDIILEQLARKLFPSKGEETWETKWCTCIDNVANAISNKTLCDDTLSSLTGCLNDMLNQLGPVDKVNEIKAIEDKMRTERTARNTKYGHAPRFSMNWKDFQELSGCYVALAEAIDTAAPDLGMTQTTCKNQMEKAIDELLKNAAKASTNVQLNDMQEEILGAMFKEAKHIVALEQQVRENNMYVLEVRELIKALDKKLDRRSLLSEFKVTLGDKLSKDFVGRRSVFEEIRNWLEDRHANNDPVMVLHGPPGAGKSTLIAQLLVGNLSIAGTSLILIVPCVVSSLFLISLIRVLSLLVFSSLLFLFSRCGQDNSMYPRPSAWLSCMCSAVT